eukprot:evm.model.scf_946.2 EVM.evm.TU.scf_946.2   scf_946:17573-20344(+)
MAPPEGWPWWQRPASAAADSRFAGCGYRTVVSTQCSVQPDEDGNPQRRCERIVKRLRECPGRPAEVLQRTEESSTEANYRDVGKGLQMPGRFDGGEEGHRGQILGSDVGQLYEDFFRVAAEFEQNYVADGASAGALGQGPQDAGCGQGDRQRQNPAPEGTDGLMGRLFGRRAKKDPEEFSSSNPKGAATAPQYKDYSQDFQEV